MLMARPAWTFRDFVSGGPMEGGCEFDERAADMTSLTEGLAC